MTSGNKYKAGKAAITKIKSEYQKVVIVVQYQGVSCGKNAD